MMYDLNNRPHDRRGEKMRHNRKNKVAWLAIAFSCLVNAAAFSPANSAAISFTPQPATNGGAIVGRIPLEKFGALELPRGRVFFKTNVIELTAIPEYQFDRQVVLSGPIIKCWSSQDGKTASINGIAYFQDGEWLKYVDENSPDKVITPDKTAVGQITSLKKGFLEVTPQGGGAAEKIAIADVQQIVSPRAYTFSVPVTAFAPTTKVGDPLTGESTSVILKPSSKVITLAAVKREPLMQSDGDTSNKKLVALWASLTAVEAAQFIPLAILLGPVRREDVRQYHGRINEYFTQANTSTVLGTQYPINSTTAPSANPYTSQGPFNAANFPLNLGF